MLILVWYIVVSAHVEHLRQEDSVQREAIWDFS